MTYRNAKGQFLPGQPQPWRNVEHLTRLTPEQVARQSAGNTSAKGKKGRAGSPWNNRPMCETPRARRFFGGGK